MFLKKLCSVFLAVAICTSVVAVSSVSANAMTPTYECSASYKTSKYYKQLLNVKLTGNCADDIVNIARSQVGYHEGNSNEELAGAGVKVEDVEGGNFTEYGYFFNNGESGYGSWCAFFVNWCARQAGISSNILYAKDGYVKNIARYYKKGINGEWHKGPGFGGTYVPMKGDIAIFDFHFDYNNGGSHIGIVSRDAKDLTHVDVIGGNEQDTVCDGYFDDEMGGQRHMSNVMGYFHPYYYKNSFADDPTHPDNYDFPAGTLKVGSKGSGVSFLQAVLYRLGYLKNKTAIDGIFGESTKTAVIRYQTDKKLTADGIVGSATLAKIAEDWEILAAKLDAKKADLPVVEEAQFIHTFVGDVNCDEEITLEDVTDLQKVLAKLNDEDKFGPVSQLDANCDDNLSMDDVITLQKHIAGLISIH